MRKLKQSKKRWAWTEKQIRKHKSLKYIGWYNPPSLYCKFLNKQNKTYEKRYLKNVELGFDLDYLELKIKNQQSSAGYSWC